MIKWFTPDVDKSPIAGRPSLKASTKAFGNPSHRDGKTKKKELF